MARLLLATSLTLAACATAPTVEATTAPPAPATTTSISTHGWVVCRAGQPPCYTTTTEGPPAPLGGVWLRLRQCESGDRYTIENPPYSGAYQFDSRTWNAQHTGYSRAGDAPYWVQDEAAVRLHSERGWEPWPVCGPRAAA